MSGEDSTADRPPAPSYASPAGEYDDSDPTHRTSAPFGRLHSSRPSPGRRHIGRLDCSTIPSVNRGAAQWRSVRRGPSRRTAYPGTGTGIWVCAGARTSDGELRESAATTCAGAARRRAVCSTHHRCAAESAATAAGAPDIALPSR